MLGANFGGGSHEIPELAFVSIPAGSFQMGDEY